MHKTLFLLTALYGASTTHAADTAVQFETSWLTVRESGSGALLGLKRTGNLDGKSVVRWTTIPGTATVGSDFGELFRITLPAGVITFMPGEREKQIVIGPNSPDPNEGDTAFVRILPSPAFEPAETFMIRLTGADVSGQAEATVEIAAHGRAVAFANSRYDVAAGAKSVVLAVQRIGSPEEGVNVEYRTRDITSVTGRPYTPVSGHLTWAPGDMEVKTITVPIAVDAPRGPLLAVEISQAANATLVEPGIALVVRD